MSQAEKYTDFSGVVTPLAKAPDLEAAVALIEQTHAVEASVNTDADSHLAKDPVVDYSEHWEIVKVAGAEANRIRIKNPGLRSFLYYGTELNVISSGLLADDYDTEQVKQMKTIRCVVDINMLIGGLNELDQVDQESISGYTGLTMEIFQAFLKIIKEVFSEQSKDAINAFKEGLFTFNHLASALTIAGQHVVFREAQDLICCKIRSAVVKSSMFKGVYIEVNGLITIHDGLNLTQVNHLFEIPMFGGKKRAEEVGVFVLENHPEIREQLIARGTKYISLTEKPIYVQNTGTLVRKSYWGDRHFKATGRVMIDMAGMRRVDSNYSFYYGYNRHDSAKSEAGLKVTDEIRMTTIPYLYGFSFASKTWGELKIENISSINFRTDAYDKLVLEEETKKLIFSLVNTEYSNDSDLISGKGGGCIFLLEGDPGVGKTLTAEAIAERLHRPLYMVSVGELGTDVDSLEAALRQILDTAAAWNAVLLIDEADIFLEARTDLDVHRNAMVGVFLRLLEYYEGILFLTTNRAANIDPAFFSRISVAIHYGKLSAQTRLKIWSTLLNNSKISKDFATALFHYDLNGRQIKNCIRNANALAHDEKRQVKYEDFQTVINTAIKFDLHLNARKREEAVKKMGFFERMWVKVFG